MSRQFNATDAAATRDALGRCLARLDACSDQVAAQLDRHFPGSGPDLAWSTDAIARPDLSGCVACAASHWRVHLDRAAALYGRLTVIHAGRVRAERARLARDAGRFACVRWLGRETWEGRGPDALALMAGCRNEAARADEGWAEAHLPALANRLWRLRAWRRAWHRAKSFSGELPGVEAACSRDLGALLAPDTAWISADIVACGRTGVVSMFAPGGTTDVRGIEWATPATGGTVAGSMAGTCDPLAFAVAAGARAVAVVGLDTAAPVLAFNDPSGCQVRAAIVGAAVRELAAAAEYAAGQARKHGSRFVLGQVAVTAWATTHNDVVEALHLRLDGVQRPAFALA